MNELNCRLLGAGETFVYAFAGAEDAEALRALLPDCTLIAMDAADWNRQLSPWPAPAIFRGQSDFAGGGEACLSEICDRVIPEIESDRAVKRRIIAGYSMAGLFSLYAASHCECFSGAVSASGSVWYEGFIDFMRVFVRGRSRKAWPQSRVSANRGKYAPGGADPARKGRENHF